METLPISPVVATGLVGGFAVARYSGRRELGGLFLAACGIWSARQWGAGLEVLPALPGG